MNDNDGARTDKLFNADITQHIFNFNFLVIERCFYFKLVCCFIFKCQEIDGNLNQFLTILPGV